MICYKDQTFCAASMDGRCAAKECFRFFSDEDRKGSERWWKDIEGEPPVAISDFWDRCEDRVEKEE